MSEEEVEAWKRRRIEQLVGRSRDLLAELASRLTALRHMGTPIGKGKKGNGDAAVGRGQRDQLGFDDSHYNTYVHGPLTHAVFVRGGLDTLLSSPLLLPLLLL